MKRQEIEKLLRIFRRSEKIKREYFKERLIDLLVHSNITIEEMEKVNEVLKSY